MNKILFIASFVLTLIFMDLIMRFTEIQSISSSVFDKDPIKRKKNVNLINFNEGFYWGGINENGFKGDTLDTNNEKNIFLIGGSFVEANQLFNRDHFMNDIKRVIEDTLKKKYSFINRGLGEQNLSDIYLSFLNVYNESSLFLIFVNPDRLHLHDYEVQNKSYVYLDNTLKVKTFEKKYVKDFLTKILHNSTLFQLIKKAIKRIQLGQFYEIIFGKFIYNFFYISGDSSKSIAMKNEYKLMSEINKKILIEMNKPNASIIFIKSPMKAQEINYKKFFNENKIDIIDLSVPLNNLKNNNIDPYFWKVTNINGHWNHLAHREVGRYLGQEIIGKIR